MTRSQVPDVRSGTRQPKHLIRVVLDTNIVVSAVLSRGGPEATTLDLALARKIQIYVSSDVFAEYEDVLRRPKFLRIPRSIINDTLALLRRIALIVKPTEIVTESSDEDDNRFLECAQAAKADYLITGNKRHFPTHWKKTRILSTSEFIYVLSEKPTDFKGGV